MLIKIIYLVKFCASAHNTITCNFFIKSVFLCIPRINRPFLRSGSSLNPKVFGLEMFYCIGIFHD